MTKGLIAAEEIKEMRHMVEQYIMLTVQFVIDEIEDTYDLLKMHPPEQVPKVDAIAALAGCDGMKRIVRQIRDICGDTLAKSLISDILNPPKPSTLVCRNEVNS